MVLIRYLHRSKNTKAPFKGVLYFDILPQMSDEPYGPEERERERERERVSPKQFRFND